MTYATASNFSTKTSALQAVYLFAFCFVLALIGMAWPLSLFCLGLWYIFTKEEQNFSLGVAAAVMGLSAFGSFYLGALWQTFPVVSGNTFAMLLIPYIVGGILTALTMFILWVIVERQINPAG